MATAANPYANDNGSRSNERGTATTNNYFINGGCSVLPENFAKGCSERALKHRISLSVDWTRDEQYLLEELLAKYTSDSVVMRYAKIAMELQDKTVRDVALRCRWMNRKENGKRRKNELNSSSWHKDKREKISDQQGNPSSNAINHAGGLPYTQLGISYRAIDSAERELLEQNYHAMDQIDANFSPSKVHENINLFHQTRNNFAALLNVVSYMPELMKRMPPPSLNLNVELINSLLPQPSMPMKF